MENKMYDVDGYEFCGVEYGKFVILQNTCGEWFVGEKCKIGKDEKDGITIGTTSIKFKTVEEAIKYIDDKVKRGFPVIING